MGFPSVGLLVLVVSMTAAASARGDVTTTQPSGHAGGGRTGAVAGRVTAPAGQLPEMIVYLEPLDPTTTPSARPPAEAVVVSQRGAKFSPSLLVVARGQTVEFRNDEDRPIEHNVFSRSPAMPFDLGLYLPPVAKRVRFDEPGAVRLYCSIHRYMDGVIYVCPTPHFARVSDDGSFRMNDVSAGEWRLRTWQRGARFDDADVVVRVNPGAGATVNLEMKRG